MTTQETPEQHAEHMRWFLSQSRYGCFTCRGGAIIIGEDMGASRYMAVEAHGDYKPGDMITGAEFERLGEPAGFRGADYPEDIAAAQDEIDAAKTKKLSSAKAKDDA